MIKRDCRRDNRYRDIGVIPWFAMGDESKIEIRQTTTRLPVDLHDWLRRYVADRYPLTQNDVIVMALKRLRAQNVDLDVDGIPLAQIGEGGR
jgi:hypothetical protein